MEGNVRQREMLGTVANEMVRLMSEHFGKGPVAAKAYLNDQFLICALEGGLTPLEKTFIEGDDESAVREVRLKFQRLMEPQFCAAVERITGRKVLSYHSQVVFDPDYVFEIFVLDIGGDAAASVREEN